MPTAAILGAGDVGGATAHALALGARLRRVLLVDDAHEAAAGKALDIRQSLAIAGIDTRVDATGDVTRIAGCAACVVADRFGPPAREWTEAEALRLMAETAPFVGHAPVVLAGASAGELLHALSAHGGIPPERLIGAAPEAFASAVRAVVAVEARCAPAEVSVSVLGAPPEPVVAWSEASIGGHALERVLTPVQLSRVTARARHLWPPQPLALGAAAAAVVEGIVRSARRAFNVLTLLDGEFGVRRAVGAVPVVLSPSGIVHRRMPSSLSTRERVQLESTLGASRGAGGRLA